MWMTEPQHPDERGWVAKSRDGVLLVAGVLMLLAETAGSLTGRSADPLIIAAAGAMIGLVPIIQKGEGGK
jgi:hypothetical protein